jgi:hypothetical protein
MEKPKFRPPKEGERAFFARVTAGDVGEMWNFITNG